MRYSILSALIFLAAYAEAVDYPSDFAEMKKVFIQLGVKFNEPKWDPLNIDILGKWTQTKAGERTIEIQFFDKGEFSWENGKIDPAVKWKREGDFIVVRDISDDKPRSYYGQVGNDIVQFNADYPCVIITRSK